MTSSWRDYGVHHLNCSKKEQKPLKSKNLFHFFEEIREKLGSNLKYNQRKKSEFITFEILRILHLPSF